VLRRAANEWFDHTLYSRLNGRKHSCPQMVSIRCTSSASAIAGKADDLPLLLREDVADEVVLVQPLHDDDDSDAARVKPCTPSASRSKPSVAPAARSAPGSAGVYVRVNP
jgi:hypothetical protein